MKTALAAAIPAEVRAPACGEVCCFHCSEPLNGSTLTVTIAGEQRPICCQGCRAVAELIASAGLDDYYRFREAPAAKPQADTATPDPWSTYSRPELASQFVQRRGDRVAVDLAIDGLRCAACSWLLNRVLLQAGALSADINAAIGRAHIEWDEHRTDLGALMRSIASAGYRPHVLDRNITQLQHQERHAALKRLCVAAFGMMQVMMFAVATYSADLSGELMAPDMRSYFRLISLVVSVPVLFYTGQPFLVGAVRSLRNRAIGMDVPVSAALLLAFLASTWNTLRGSGEVYFDSITMFLFFLTLGRFVEMSVRHRSAGVTDALARHLPAVAHRERDGRIEDIPTAALKLREIVSVRPGELAPVDGVIIDGTTQVNEALLTGESQPVQRGPGDRIAAGTLNIDNNVRIEVAAVGGNTLLSGIVALLRRAQAQKPALSLAADRAAARFTSYVLIGAAIVCAGWLLVDASRAFEATLAVLVVACPCAFAIAMPAALAATSGELARRGVLVARLDSLEALARTDRVLFDKTGTLTLGEVRLERCVPRGALSEQQCLIIAAALERASAHPIARAFHRLDTGAALAREVSSVPGFGIEGLVHGKRYRLGVAGYVAQLGAHDTARAEWLADRNIVLGDADGPIAAFAMTDAMREDSSQAVAQLRALGVAAEILSGDSHPAVADVAQRCGIDTFLARRSPAQKLARAQELREQGHRVVMIGDGINDAPVLGAADVSVAMGRGAALAVAAADLILVNERLTSLPAAIAVARKTMAIARQNLFWSAAYNLSALPLAALGWIPPWAAAIGMSVSSILVILNATRLAPRSGTARPPTPNLASSVSASRRAARRERMVEYTS